MELDANSQGIEPAGDEKQRAVYLELAKLSHDAHNSRRTVEWKVAFGLWTGIAAFTYFAVTHAEKLPESVIACLWWSYALLTVVFVVMWQGPLRRAFEQDKLHNIIT